MHFRSVAHIKKTKTNQTHTEYTSSVSHTFKKIRIKKQKQKTHIKNNTKTKYATEYAIPYSLSHQNKKTDTPKHKKKIIIIKNKK